MEAGAEEQVKYIDIISFDKVDWSKYDEKICDLFDKDLSETYFNKIKKSL